MNYIGEKGGTAIATAIEKNSTLTQLDLSGNNIGDLGVDAIAKSIAKNSALTSLHLGYNLISDEGGKSIAYIIENNSTLTSLILWKNDISTDGGEKIEISLEKNSVLLYLDMWGNRKHFSCPISTYLERNRRAAQWMLDKIIWQGHVQCHNSALAHLPSDVIRIHLLPYCKIQPVQGFFNCNIQNLVWNNSTR